MWNRNVLIGLVLLPFFVTSQPEFPEDDPGFMQMLKATRNFTQYLFLTTEA
jgi:hypothetical protein